MSAHQKFPLRDAQDVTGLVLSLPVTSQLTIALEIIRGRDLYRMDGDELDRAECALCSLLSEARENAYYEDRALHGGAVSA